MNKKQKVLMITALILGLCLVLLGIGLSVQSYLKTKDYAKVQGTLISVTTRHAVCSGGQSRGTRVRSCLEYTSLIKYKDTQGTDRQYINKYTSTSPLFNVGIGGQVNLVYNPKSPEDVLPDVPFYKWWGNLLFSFFGVGFLIFSGFLKLVKVEK